MRKSKSPNAVACGTAAMALAGMASATGFAGSATAATVENTAADSGPPAIIVTAQRRRENSQKVPLSINTISAEQIKDMGVRSTDDIAYSIPNVSITSPNGTGQQPSIVIRGIGVNDFDTNNPGPNGIYVDDVFISAPSAQAFGILDIDQIQVLKGPQGTLYGRNTSGGAVIFTSARPTDDLHLDSHVEYGSFNTYSISGAMSGAVADHLDARIAVVHNQSDGFEHNILTGTPAGGSNNEAVRLQLLYQPSDQLKILASATIGYSHVQPLEYTSHGAFSPGTQGNANPTVCTPAQVTANQCVNLFGYGAPNGFYDGEWSRDEKGHNLNQIYQLREDYTMGSIDLVSISAFQSNNHFNPEDSDGGPLNTFRVNYRDRSSTFSQEIRLSQNANRYHWVAGLYYLHESLYQEQPLSLFYNGDLYGGLGIPAGTGNFDNVAEIIQDSSHQITNAPALYGQGDYTIGKLTLTLGGRLTYEQKSFDYLQTSQFQEGGQGNYGSVTDQIPATVGQRNTSVTWKAGLNYDFTPAIMAYASVSTGIKSGDFNGSFLSSTPQQALFQLQPVAPEHVTSYELGEKATFFRRRLTLNAALFYNDYKNEQIFAQVPQQVSNQSGQQITIVTNILANAAKAHTEGAEIELAAHPMAGLVLSAEPAFLQARIDEAGLPVFSGATPLDGNQQANAPHFSFFGRIEYSVNLANGNRLTAGWSSTYKSHVFFSPTEDPYLQQNGFWLHAFNASVEFSKRLKFSIYVRNVTGTKYLINASDLISPFDVVSGVPGAPRTFGGSIDFRI
jgi:iron complex outermembrane recepter protein